jgi:hypothetical protein
MALLIDVVKLKHQQCNEIAGNLLKDELPIELNVIIRETLTYALQGDVNIGFEHLKDLRVISDLIKGREKRVAAWQHVIDADLKERLMAAKMLYADPDKKQYYGPGYLGMMQLSQKLGVTSTSMESAIVKAIAVPPKTGQCNIM